MAQNNTNEQATNITARINVMAPVPNIDINYGPYDSVDAAFETLTSYGAIAKGLTVGVNTESGIQEYWFKNGVTKNDLVEKLADQGVTDYNDLENKPKIGNKVLDNQTTLSDIGAASETALTTHTGNSNIHVSSAQKTQLSNLPTSMKYGNTAISTFTIDGEKLTIHVGNSDYSFRLTEWHDIADFYVLYGEVSYSNGAYQIKIDGTNKPFANVTANELMTLSDSQYGYPVLSSANKISMEVKNVGTIKCDYTIKDGNFNENATALMIMYRTSGTNLPSLQNAVYTNVLDGAYIYGNGANLLNSYLAKSGLVVGEATYSLVTYYNSQKLEGNDYGITF